jgi:sporulation protein YunB
MARMRLKKGIKYPKLNKLTKMLLLITLGIILLLIYISNKVTPILLNYAEVEGTKIASLIINKAVNEEIVDDIEIDKLFTLVKNDAGEIQTIDFNPIIVNKVLSMTTNIVQMNLKAIEQGKISSVEIPDDILAQYDKKNLARGIIYEIPLGVITNNVFLSNFGPHIPVKLSLIGDVISNINTKINQYGINNAMIEVSVHISVAEQVNIPMMSRRVNVSSDIPIAIKIVQGKIPQYYQGSGIEKNSSILALPME